MANLSATCPTFKESDEWKRLIYNAKLDRTTIIFLCVANILGQIVYWVNCARQRKMRRQMKDLESGAAMHAQNNSQQESARAPELLASATASSTADIGLAVPLGGSIVLRDSCCALSKGEDSRLWYNLKLCVELPPPAEYWSEC